MFAYAALVRLGLRLRAQRTHSTKYPEELETKGGAGEVLRRRRVVAILTGISGLRITSQLWLSYIVFCRPGAVYPFNQFLHRYVFALGGMALALLTAMVAGVVASLLARKWWWLLTSFAAFGTLVFLLRQVT